LSLRKVRDMEVIIETLKIIGLLLLFGFFCTGILIIFVLLAIRIIGWIIGLICAIYETYTTTSTFEENYHYYCDWDSRI